MHEQIIELSNMQIDRAKEILGFIPQFIDLGDYNTAVNRAYYAVFHAIKAVEITDGFDSKKHSGLLSHFRQKYIKTGIFDEKYSEMLKSLSQTRTDSDYNMIIKFTADDAKEQYENAREIVSSIESFLNKKYK